jgi:excisionase family DNA binding protein
MPSHYVRCTKYSLQVWNVSVLLGVPKRTVRYWAKSGKLHGIKNGPKLWCFCREDVDRRWQEMLCEAELRACRRRRTRPAERQPIGVATRTRALDATSSSEVTYA